MNPLNVIRNVIRRIMHVVAIRLNQLTGGKLTPNAVTIVGLLAHLPIAYLIATRHNLKAAALLAVFGLFDTLDGELARLQKRDGPAGMLLDASADRIKEVMLYTGAAYAISTGTHSQFAAWAVVACGASLTVSYVKAKGETAVAKSRLSASEVNHLFADGLMRFEIRMAVLLLGLLSNNLLLAIVVIGILASLTAISRLIKISRKIKNVQD